MKIDFKRKVLKNGMTILFERRNTPVVSVAFAIRSGGVNETKSEKGISHFIEHMLYKGTKKRNSKQIAEEIEKKGGQLNGFTGENITAFWCKIPSRYLNVALDVLSDMVKNPLFDEKEMEKERKVIFEEIKMYKDNPRMHAMEKIHSFLYKEPFGIPILGTYESMNLINREKITERFKESYTPDNMILCIVGNANFSRIINFAEKSFGNEKGQISKVKVVPRNKQKIEKRKGVDQANLVFAYHVSLFRNKKSYAASILNALMTEGMSSRLFMEIRERRNLAYALKGASEISKDFAYNLIYAGTMKENVKKVKGLILNEFEKVSKDLTTKELKQVKEQVIGNYLISREDSQEQMVNLLQYEIEGNAKDFYKFEKNIKSVKLIDVKNLAKKARKKYSFFALVPSK